MKTELEAALLAVRRAAQVTRRVQVDLVNAETIEKKDKSPVTVADFASQAIVCATLREALKDDAIVGEEDAQALRDDGAASLRSAVTRHVNSVLPSTMREEDVLAAIDLGNAKAEGPRYWTLDPIDGTKGFLRKQQYAIALALIENGKVALGVLGCPNLDHNEVRGTMLYAIRGEGARAAPLEGGNEVRISVSEPASLSAARFCESVEAAHSNQSEAAQIGQRLGIESSAVRMDSQAKYAAVARGDAHIYLRLPKSKSYTEKIWDHAAGSIVVEEAGGIVTDTTGAPLDFTQGHLLSQNAGIVATSRGINEKVLEAVGAVLKSAH